MVAYPEWLDPRRVAAGDVMSEQKDWDDYARRYAPSLIGPYHTHRLAVIRDVISRGGGGQGC